MGIPNTQGLVCAKYHAVRVAGGQIQNARSVLGESRAVPQAAHADKAGPAMSTAQKRAMLASISFTHCGTPDSSNPDSFDESRKVFDIGTLLHLPLSPAVPKRLWRHCGVSVRLPRREHQYAKCDQMHLAESQLDAEQEFP